MNRSLEKLNLICLSLLFFCLDRGLKALIQEKLVLGQSIPIIPNVFHITYVENSGAAFSFLQQYPFLLLILTGFLFLAFLVYCLTRPSLSILETLAFSLLLGGSVGNITDRLMVGRVIDYFDATLIHYPIFNLADTFIFIGVTLLLITHAKSVGKPHPTSL